MILSQWLMIAVQQQVPYQMMPTTTQNQVYKTEMHLQKDYIFVNFLCTYFNVSNCVN